LGLTIVSNNSLIHAMQFNFKVCVCF